MAFVYHFVRQTFDLNHYSAFVKNVFIGAFRSALPLQVWGGMGSQLSGGPFWDRPHLGVPFGVKRGCQKTTPFWEPLLDPLFGPLEPLGRV